MKGIFIRFAPATQRGSALGVGLIFLLLLTLLGVAAIQGSSLQERMAGNLRDKDLAFQSAEAALREAERFLQNPVLPAFDRPEDGLSPPRNNALRNGYWSPPQNWSCPPSNDVAALHHCWSRDAAVLGDNSDNPPEDLSTTVSALPRYFMEQMPPTPDPQGSLAADQPIPDITMFRITARGVGGRDTSVVILQSTYRR